MIKYIHRIIGASRFLAQPRSLRSILTNKPSHGPPKSDLNLQRIVGRLRFPADAFWHGALDFLSGGKLTDRDSLGPIEFKKYLPDLVPSSFSFFEPVEAFEVVIIHKGLLDDYSNSLLKRITSALEYAYGNAVFNIFVAKSLGRRSGGAQKHLFRYDDSPPNDIPDRSICLVTAGGFGNLGDDAITHAAEKILAENFPGRPIVHQSPPVPKRDLLRSDLLVLGGGGLFYDSCLYNLQNYTLPLFWANEAKIPRCCLGIGLQGIRTALGRRVYREALKGCLFVSVRDRRDREILETVCGGDPPIVLSQDLAFSLSPRILPGTSRPKRRTGESKRPMVYLALQDTTHLLASHRYQTYQSTIRSLPDRLAPYFDLTLIVQSRNDLPLYQSLSSRGSPPLPVVSFSRNEVEAAAACYARGDIVVTSRLHGFILACLAGKPVVATGTINGKIHRLIVNSMPEMHKSFIPITRFTPENVIKKLERISIHPDEFTISEFRLARCREAASVNEQWLRIHAAQIR